MHTTNGKLPQKEKDAMDETSLKKHFYEMDKKEKESLKKFWVLRKDIDKNREIQLSDETSVGTNSENKIDNRNT